MGNPPLVSIMIPTYGQEAFIRQAVDSALAQDYPCLEVVVADDASPDRTAEVLAACADPRLRVRRNPANLGRVANYRQTLYDLARGEWVLNLDGDDFLTDPGFISAAVAAALAEPGVVVVAGRQVMQLRNGRERVSASPGNRILSGLEVLARLHRPEYRFAHLATLYNRRAALDCGFYRSDTLSSDWESLFRLALRGRVAYLDRVAGVWRFRPDSACHAPDWRKLAENLRVWPTIFQDAARAGLPLDRARAMGQKMIRLHAGDGLAQLLAQGAARDALRFLRAARELDRSLPVSLLGQWRFPAKLLLAVWTLWRGGKRPPCAA